MRFKDKDGNVFEDIRRARKEFCSSKHAVCSRCPLRWKSGICETCGMWCDTRPAEAARLMGYEVIPEPGVDFPMPEYDPSDVALKKESVPTCKWCHEEVCVNADSPMRADYCPVPDAPGVCRHEDRGDVAVEGMCCDCANGGPCCDWSENEDCPERKDGGSCWRPFTEKEVNMDKQKPRICEVLGVEVGELFTAATPYGNFTRCQINEEGQLLCAGTNVLCYIINHPESIIRKPRFTEEEVADAKTILRLFPRAWERIDRNLDGSLSLDDGNGWAVVLERSLFPSIRPGQGVELSEIVGGAEREEAENERL